MNTYAAYVWSALAIFFIGLLWDFISPMLRIRALRRRKARQDLMNTGDKQ